MPDQPDDDERPWSSDEGFSAWLRMFRAMTPEDRADDPAYAVVYDQAYTDAGRAGYCRMIETVVLSGELL